MLLYRPLSSKHILPPSSHTVGLSRSAKKNPLVQDDHRDTFHHRLCVDCVCLSSLILLLILLLRTHILMQSSYSKDLSCFPSDDQAETWILYQLADSALPTGGFVVSSGLECLEQIGLLSSLSQFLQASVDTYARSNLPFVAAAYDANSLDTLSYLDDTYDAYLVNTVARRASMAQGLALLNLYLKSYTSPNAQPPSDLPPQVQREQEEGRFGDPGRLRAFRDQIRLTHSPGHHVIAFGVAARYWGIRRGKL